MQISTLNPKQLHLYSNRRQALLGIAPSKVDLACCRNQDFRVLRLTYRNGFRKRTRPPVTAVRHFMKAGYRSGSSPSRLGTKSWSAKARDSYSVMCETDLHHLIAGMCRPSTIGAATLRRCRCRGRYELRDARTPIAVGERSRAAGQCRHDEQVIRSHSGSGAVRPFPNGTVSEQQALYSDSQIGHSRRDPTRRSCLASAANADRDDRRAASCRRRRRVLAWDSDRGEPYND